MLKTTKKTVSAIVAAALIAGAFTLLSGGTDQVVASAPLNSGKGDRLDIRTLGTKCSEQAWPYFEAKCTRDRREIMGQARTVRIIATDRVVVR